MDPYFTQGDKMIDNSKKRYCFNVLPEQLLPSPDHPVLQSQVNEPTLFLHSAFPSQS